MKTMDKLLLLLILLIFAYTDCKYFSINNYLAWTGIILGILLTGHWFSPVIVFVTLVALHYHELTRFGGGDLKLFTMIAAFLGWMIIPIYLLTILFIKLYRDIFNYRLGIAVAPFALLGSLFFMFI